jgi:hypothetical protein
VTLPRLAREVVQPEHHHALAKCNGAVGQRVVVDEVALAGENLEFRAADLPCTPSDMLLNGRFSVMTLPS